MSAGARVRGVARRHANELSLGLLLLFVLATHLAISGTPRDGFVFD